MSKMLTVVEQKEVTFYEDDLTAVQADNGQIYVAVRRMCDALGLDPRNQRRRIQDHTILSEGYRRGVIYAPPGEQGGGGPQEAGLLRVDLVPLWLAGIHLKRVKKEIRPKIEQFQREAANVLWEAFQEGRLTTDPIFDELLQQDTDAVQAYKMLQALVKLARNQVLIEAQLSTHGEQLVNHEQRLEDIEARLNPGEHITADQAVAISQAVKAVAIAIGKQSGRNEFGGVYGELYRRYRVPSYKELPAGKYDDAIKWLGEWLQSLTGDEPF